MKFLFIGFKILSLYSERLSLQTLFNNVPISNLAIILPPKSRRSHVSVPRVVQRNTNGSELDTTNLEMYVLPLGHCLALTAREATNQHLKILSRYTQSNE